MTSRREFIGSSAAVAALAASGVRLDAAPSGRKPGQRWDEACRWMKLSLAYFHAGGVKGRPERVAMARQMGVLGGVGGGGANVAETRRAYEEAGLEWTVLEGVNLTRAQLGVDGRDEDIARFITLIRDCAAVGQRIICYNWMPAVNWARSDTARVDRGGSLVTAFDIEKASTELTEYGDRFTHDDLWKNMEYFLHAVVPEAESTACTWRCTPTIRLSTRLRGIPRIITSIDALKRVTQIYPSKHNGLTFCQGSIASQGPDVDIPAAIRWFGDARADPLRPLQGRAWDADQLRRGLARRWAERHVRGDEGLLRRRLSRSDSSRPRAHGGRPRGEHVPGLQQPRRAVRDRLHQGTDGSGDEGVTSLAVHWTNRPAGAGGAR